MTGKPGGHLPRGPLGAWRAMWWSLHGLRDAWRYEPAFRLEACLFVVLAPLGLWLGDGVVEKVLLVGCLLLVLAAELLNSSIETVIDRYGNELHVLTGRAKDMASAAVFVLLLNVVFVWAMLLGPRVL